MAGKQETRGMIYFTPSYSDPNLIGFRYSKKGAAISEENILPCQRLFDKQN